jgi:hypothetical protein
VADTNRTIELGRSRKTGHHRAARGTAPGSPRSGNFLMALASYPRADGSPASRACNSAPGNAGSHRHCGRGSPVASWLDHVGRSP